ncbi:MAG: SirB2 family protein [Rhodoferax sp.]
MALTDFYPQIRILHIGLVVVSGSLFLARGLAVLRGASWPMALAVRRASYGIDTALLMAALTLMHILQLNPLQAGWLGTKILLLLLYIVLGTMALKRAQTSAAKATYLVAALLCLGYMASVARAHSPWGLFAAWLSI